MSTAVTPAHRAPQRYQLVETRLQQRLDKGRTRLWRCTLRHGQRGFCKAHVNRYGTLYNLSYGIISAIDVGPIEAKPIRHYRPGTRVMGVLFEEVRAGAGVASGLRR